MGLLGIWGNWINWLIGVNKVIFGKWGIEHSWAQSTVRRHKESHGDTDYSQETQGNTLRQHWSAW